MFSLVLPHLSLRANTAPSWHTLKQSGARVRTALCALHGHELVLHFERGRRVCLRCLKCGYETPGWSTR